MCNVGVYVDTHGVHDGTGAITCKLGVCKVRAGYVSDACARYVRTCDKCVAYNCVLETCLLIYVLPACHYDAVLGCVVRFNVAMKIMC